MPRTPVTRDVTDPAFPHGEPRGYERGCSGKPGQPACPATPSCRKARTMQVKRRAIAKLAGSDLYVDASLAREHVAKLQEAAPHLSLPELCRMAGLPTGTAENLRRNPRVTKVTLERLLALTPAKALEDARRMPLAPLVHDIRKLQAAGFPLAWQCQRAGLSLSYLETCVARWTLGEQTSIAARIATAHAALTREIGTRMADPETDGLVRHAVGLARAVGRRAGYLPPAAYDDEGNANLRWLPGHPWNVADDECTDLLEVLRLSVTTTLGPAAIARRMGGDNRRLIHRVRERARLKYLPDPLGRGETRLDPSCADAVERVKEALDEYDFRAGDPVLLCLRLGVTSENGSSSIPRDHPAVALWRAERLAAKEATAAATAQPVDLDDLVAA